VGVIAVLGLAVRNTLLLVRRYQQLDNQAAKESGAALIARGTEERSASILMSAICTALAMLPLVLVGNVAGLEIAHPLAVVVLGGLVTSTLVTLLGVPAMYAVCGAAVSDADVELADEMPASAAA
jgi:Cu/Ag efflux pump CusA